ncbi:MAG: NADH-quinone oxidoreductase subunit NuoE family protein [Planctomycetota bacterium]
MSRDGSRDAAPGEPARHAPAPADGVWEIPPGLRRALEAVSGRPSKAALLGPILAAAERELGGLSPPSLEAIARELGLPIARVLETLSRFGFAPTLRRGAHAIEICTSVSCALRGAEDLLRHLERRLSIRAGETTLDGRVTLEACGCLGACDEAPAALVDGELRGRLTVPKLDAILEGFE